MTFSFTRGRTVCTPIPAVRRLWYPRRSEPSGLRMPSAGRTARITICPPKAAACGTFWCMTPSREYGWKRMTRRHWISAGTTASFTCCPPTGPCGRWMQTRAARSLTGAPRLRPSTRPWRGRRCIPPCISGLSWERRRGCRRRYGATTGNGRRSGAFTGKAHSFSQCGQDGATNTRYGCPGRARARSLA